MIIDFHTHTFPDSISRGALDSLSKGSHVSFFTDGTVTGLIESMKESGVDYSVNLPVMTKAGQVEKVNESLIRKKDELFEKGVITFGGLHPDYEDYKNEIARLKDAGIKGVKLHPAFQGHHINHINYKRLVSAISEAGLITLVHAGIDIGFLDRNDSSVPELIDLIDDVRPEKLVLAHMGGWQAWDEVESELAGANVWFDTAFSLGKVCLVPGEEDMVPYKENLGRDAFVRLVRSLGIDKVLFATDSPWSKQEEYIRLINETDLSNDEKEAIFYRNAAALLGL